MKIPKIISKNNHEYIFVKKYPNYIMYEDMITHTKECFCWHELGLIKEKVAVTEKTTLKGITGMKV